MGTINEKINSKKLLFVSFKIFSTTFIAISEKVLILYNYPGTVSKDWTWNEPTQNSEFKNTHIVIHVLEPTPIIIRADESIAHDVEIIILFRKLSDSEFNQNWFIFLF